MAAGLPSHRRLVAVQGHPGLWRVKRHLPVVPGAPWCPVCKSNACPWLVLRRPHGAEELRARLCCVREVEP